MLIQSAAFIGSYVTEKTCPATALPEFAFIGRSNVGKSSLINMLVNRKDLVKVSGAPGKTQTLNFFLINDRMYFVDLPGYGYAKVSRSLRHQWSDMIRAYLRQRKTLQCVFILIDSRLQPQRSDLDFIDQLAAWQIPFALVFTKSDKVSKSKVQMHMQQLQKSFDPPLQSWPVTFVSSAVTKAGKEELLKFIDRAIRD